MAHKSRLSRMLSQPKSDELKVCCVCRCTEETPCVTEDGPCSWVLPDLCSNPDCIAAVATTAFPGEMVYEL